MQELRPEQLVLHKIIGLVHAVIQEVLVLELERLFLRFGLAIEKLLMILVQFLRIGKLQKLLEKN